MGSLVGYWRVRKKESPLSFFLFLSRKGKKGLPVNVIAATHGDCGEVRIPAEIVTIDDERTVYLFSCPECGRGAVKEMDARIRALLRGAGVPTLEERVESEAVELLEDMNIWRAMLA